MKWKWRFNKRNYIIQTKRNIKIPTTYFKLHHMHQPANSSKYAWKCPDEDGYGGGQQGYSGQLRRVLQPTRVTASGGRLWWWAAGGSSGGRRSVMSRCSISEDGGVRRACRQVQQLCNLNKKIRWVHIIIGRYIPYDIL